MSASAWEALLDRFERDLDAAEPHALAWAAPADPLPADLADRARALLARQHARVRMLAAELDDARRHLDALERVPANEVAPAYLDVRG